MKKKGLWSMLLCLALLISPTGFNSAHATDSNTTLQITSSQVLEIDQINSTTIQFYTDANKTTLAGSLQVKLQYHTESLTPAMFGGMSSAVYDLGNHNTTIVSIELQPNNTAGFRAPVEYTFDSNKLPLRGTNFDLSILGGTTSVLDLDFVFNQSAPTASNVSFTGSLCVGATLTGNYTYFDADGDPEGSSTFQWYRSNDTSGTAKKPIAGANAKTYVLSDVDAGKFISFEVTPIATTGTRAGVAVESAINGAVALATVETPTFDPAGGAFTAPQNVTLICATGGAALRYTTDGNDPTNASTLFTEPIPVTATTTIKAKAFKTGMSASAIASATYTISNTSALTVTPSGFTSYTQGKATGNARFTITSGDGSLNATNNYRSATLDGQALALGSVRAPGTDGSVADGSLIATINQAKLNTLPVGNHTLVITLGGAFANQTVMGTITVTPTSDVPRTGDGMPLIGLAVLMLLSCGSALLLLTRKGFAKR